MEFLIMNSACSYIASSCMIVEEVYNHMHGHIVLCEPMTMVRNLPIMLDNYLAHCTQIMLS